MYIYIYIYIYVYIYIYIHICRVQGLRDLRRTIIQHMRTTATISTNADNRVAVVGLVAIILVR